MSTFTSEPGIRLGGRYRLEDRIAASGGWSAWKAIDEILARPVSVIMFAAGFPRLEQVITAARAASRLADTRLMQVFDVEDSWEHGYVVLEWPVGDTLADLVSGGGLEPTAGARIIAEAASAMSAAHAAGLAHLCLRPDAVRWTAGGGVKITGLGIDAALEGITADDPERADTEGLGRLLYAALTGMWPGPDYPDLPMAPTLDGQPRRPRQVRAGVPTALDEVAGRALALGGHDGHAYGSPAEVASALRAVLPPVQVPAAPPRERDRDSMPRQQVQAGGDGYPGYRYRQYQPGPPPRRRSPGRVVAMTIAVLVAVVGVSAAAVHLLHQPHSPGHPGGGGKSGTTTSPAAAGTTLTPVRASGFDALNPKDAGDENSFQAPNVLDGKPQGWSTQQYDLGPQPGPTQTFGNLKAGTGLILTLARQARVTAITVQFGAIPGADVEILVGNSAARSAANLHSMQEIASANGVGGTYAFRVTKPASGRYVVIWFTKLPPMANPPNGKYMATVYSVTIKGTD
jgi:hypothetical protein